MKFTFPGPNVSAAHLKKYAAAASGANTTLDLSNLALTILRDSEPGHLPLTALEKIAGNTSSAPTTVSAADKASVFSQLRSPCNPRELAGIATHLVQLYPLAEGDNRLKDFIGRATLLTSEQFQFRMRLAQGMLESLAQKDGFVKLMVPQGLTFVEALEILNEYFREQHPRRGKAIVPDPEDIAMFETAGSEDIRGDRTIVVDPSSIYTWGGNRTEQLDYLCTARWRPATPLETALVVAAKAASSPVGHKIRNRSDFLKSRKARTAEPGTALEVTERDGLSIQKLDDAIEDVEVGMACAPL